jgi:membrane-associated phospholipid phosphatase
LIVADRLCANRTVRLARWLSILGHPFVTAPLTVGILASRIGSPGQAAQILVVFLIVAVLPGTILMVYKVRRGAWENVDASKVSERPILFVVAILSTLVLLGWFTAIRPQPMFVRAILGFLAMTVVCAAATRWVKVSLHVACAAFAATTLILLGSVAGWVLALLVPALAWSRCALGRHTPLEPAFGALSGIAAGLGCYFL